MAPRPAFGRSLGHDEGMKPQTAMTPSEAVAALPRRVSLRSLVGTPAVVAAGTLAVLVAASALLRTGSIAGPFWIDEGLSVGIAHHSLWDIPGLLRQDGSPPLYYMLLHLWIGAFGDGERATHAFSLVLALACIPLAYWVASTFFGRVAGLICAALAAVDPYLTYYAQETRMYTLMAFLSFVVVAAYAQGVIRGRRRWLPLLAVTLAAALYTHNWAIFLCVALAAATLVAARHRWREAAFAGAGVVLLYLPWVPTLLSQARHTGAPWSVAPGLRNLLTAPGTVLAGDAPLMAFVLAGGTGLAVVVRRRGDDR